MLALLFMLGCTERVSTNHVNMGADKSTGTFLLPPPLQSAAFQSESINAWITMSAEGGSFVQRDAMRIVGGQAIFEKNNLTAGVYSFVIEFEVDYINDAGVQIPIKLAIARKSNVVLGAGSNPIEFLATDYLYPDDDGDGVFNIKELELGTDPTDPGSKPSVSCKVVNGVIVCDDNIFLISGEVQGLTATGLVLMNNNDGTDRLALPENAVDFRFNKRLSPNANYDVSIYSQPSKQFCFVNNRQGKVEQNNITNVQVICSDAYNLGGTVFGLNGVVILDNNGEQISISNTDARINAPFIFKTSLPSGQNYAVTVATQPEDRFCTVRQGAGLVADSDVATITLNCLPKVKPHYVTNGAGWTRYVANNGIAKHKATGAACSSMSPGYDSCVHGGEIYSVVVHGLAGCENITATDALQFFDWICDDTVSPVTIASNGLRQGVTLSDMIDFMEAAPSWRNNALTVFADGNVHGLTPQTPWLAPYSPIVLANDGIAPGTAKSGNVYAVTADVNFSYVIDADNVALVVQPGVGLSGGTGSAVVETTSTASFTWLEGDIVSSAGSGVLMNANHSVINELRVSNATDIGVTIGASNSDIRNVKVASNGSAGFSGNDGIVTLPESKNNKFSNIFSTNNNYMGIRSQGANETWANVSSSNNNRGFVFEGHDNRYIGVTANNNANEGMTFGGASGFAGNNVMINATSVNNGYLGLDINNRSNISIMNLAIAANATDITGFGVFVTNSSGHTLANVAIANNGGTGYTGPSIFTGVVHYGNNADTTCVGCDTTPTDPVITYGIDIAESFVAEAGFDVINTTTQIGGGALIENITDWFNFENRFRSWGGSHVQPFPNTGDRKNCRSGEACVIWDWSLSLSDAGNGGFPALRAALARPADLTEGQQTLKHLWSAKSQQSCEAISGAVWEINTCYTVFLRNAFEVDGDDIGNDNGVCESNETCVYTPNIASYQGHGDLVSAGIFSGQGLTGITLMQHSVNGY